MIVFAGVNWVVYQGTEAISMQEVKEALGALKNWKALGLNKVMGEAIKNWGE